MALIIYCVRGQRAHKYCRCVQRIKLSDASRCSRNSWTCLFFKNFKCIIFTGITYFYPVPHNMHTQIRTLSGSHLFTTMLLPTIQVTNTAHSNHIQYVPKVLEQTSKVWTRLGVVSTHAPDAVCLALVCVRLCASAYVRVCLRAFHRKVLTFDSIYLRSNASYRHKIKTIVRPRPLNKTYPRIKQDLPRIRQF